MITSLFGFPLDLGYLQHLDTLLCLKFLLYLGSPIRMDLDSFLDLGFLILMDLVSLDFLLLDLGFLLDLDSLQDLLDLDLPDLDFLLGLDFRLDLDFQTCAFFDTLKIYTYHWSIQFLGSMIVIILVT